MLRAFQVESGNRYGFISADTSPCILALGNFANKSAKKFFSVCHFVQGGQQRM